MDGPARKVWSLAQEASDSPLATWCLPIEAAGILSFAPTQAAIWADFDIDTARFIYWNDIFIKVTEIRAKFYFNNRGRQFSLAKRYYLL